MQGKASRDFDGQTVGTRHSRFTTCGTNTRVQDTFVLNGGMDEEVVSVEVRMS